MQSKIHSPWAAYLDRAEPGPNVKINCLFFFSSSLIWALFTPSRNHGEVIFLLQFVWVCVCVCLSVCEQNADQTATLILTRSSLSVAYSSCLNPIEIGDLGSKVKVTVTQYPVFLQNSLLNFLIYISAFLCLIKLNFGIPHTYALCIIVCEFDWNQIGDDVI